MRRRYVVQKFIGGDAEGDRWLDVAGTVEASDPGAALAQAVTANPLHRIEGTTYRVCEHALSVNVSINLEEV